MSVDVAYSTSNRNVGKVILQTNNAVSRAKKSIAGIELNSTVFNVDKIDDKLTNIQLNTSVLNISVSGINTKIEAVVTKPPSNSINYKTNILYDIKRSKSAKLNYKGLQDERYNARMNVKRVLLGFPLNINVPKGNSISYPRFSLTNYDTSKSINNSYAKNMILQCTYIKKKNSICTSIPLSMMIINSDISYSFSSKAFNPIKINTTVINVSKEKRASTSLILNSEVLRITAFKALKTELKLMKYGNPTIFNVSAPIDTNTQTTVTKDIDTIRFVVQKNSFIELYIKFTHNKITSVIGLPDGMFLEGDYIKGSPTLAGTYNIKLLCYDEPIMEGIIEVPNVPRKF